MVSEVGAGFSRLYEDEEEYVPKAGINVSGILTMAAMAGAARLQVLSVDEVAKCERQRMQQKLSESA
eukprot:Skav201319  [mRNA]  locus=scaffold500:15029:18147:- [translate_table: standard]